MKRKNKGKVLSTTSTKSTKATSLLIEPKKEPTNFALSTEFVIKTPKDILKFWLYNLPFFLLIALLVVLVFGNALSGSFLNADDLKGIVQNASVHHLGSSLKTFNLIQIFEATTIALFGDAAWVFHVQSMFYHLLNIILVFTLAYILYGKKVAIISSLIFSVHPVVTETVSWISAISYLFVNLIFLNVLISYTLYKQEKKLYYLLYASAFYGVGLAVTISPWLLTLPFVLVAFDQFVLEKKLTLSNYKNFILMGVISLIFVFGYVVTAYSRRITDLQNIYYLNPGDSIPILNRIPYTTYRMLELFIFPKNLSIYHDDILIDPRVYLVMILSSLAFFTLTFVLVKKRRELAGFSCMLLLTLLPIFSPVVIASLITERYLYMGTCFFAIFLGICLKLLVEKVHHEKLYYLILIPLIFGYSLRSHLRTYAWLSNKNLWFATLQTDPLSYRVHNNIGDVYTSESNYPKAIEYFKKSLELKPDYADAAFNIGASYLYLNDLDNAITYFELASKKNPRLYDALTNLAYIYNKKGDKKRAQDYLSQVLSANPTDTHALFMRDKIK